MAGPLFFMSADYADLHRLMSFRLGNRPRCTAVSKIYAIHGPIRGRYRVQFNHYAIKNGSKQPLLKREHAPYDTPNGSV